jgi:hypothetical protein
MFEKADGIVISKEEKSVRCENQVKHRRLLFFFSCQLTMPLRGYGLIPIDCGMLPLDCVLIKMLHALRFNEIVAKSIDS